MPRRKTQEEFLEEIDKLVGNEYTVLGDYKGTEVKLEFLHKKCNNVFKMRPHNFLAGNRCPICFGPMSKKKTTKQYKKEVYEKVADEYAVISEYINNKTKIKFHHKICNSTFYMRADAFIRGSRCPSCSNKKNSERQTKPLNVFVKEFNNITKGEYKIIGNYINASTKILIQHIKCGEEFYILPTNTISNGISCPFCRDVHPKRNTRTFKNEIFDLVKDEYKVLGEYIRSNVKINFLHTKCGNEFKMIPSNFLNGSRCPKCACNARRTTKDFKNKVFAQVGVEFSVLGEYINNKTKIKMRHNICGFEYSIKPEHFLNSGIRCAKCSGNYSRTTSEFIEEVKKLTGDDFSVLGEYINSNTRILIRHNYCNRTFETTPGYFLKNQSCPRCLTSYGEREIENWLNEREILFESQKSFKKLKYILPLKYDFYVPIKKGNGILIEYNGRQHYEYSSIYHGSEENYTIQIKRDELKKNFAIKNDYELLEIPYWDFPKIGNYLENIFADKITNKSLYKGKVYKTKNEEFKAKIFSKVGNDYSILSDFKGSKRNINVKHNVCGYEFTIIANTFLNNNQSCPMCRGQVILPHIFPQEVKKLVGDEYTLLSEYEKSSIPVKIRHNVCGYTYSVRRGDFLRGTRCPLCAGQPKKNTEYFKNEIEKVFQGEYTVLGEYVNNKENILFRHNICGGEFLRSPHNMIRSKSCPVCRLRHNRQYTQLELFKK